MDAYPITPSLAQASANLALASYNARLSSMAETSPAYTLIDDGKTDFIVIKDDKGNVIDFIGGNVVTVKLNKWAGWWDFYHMGLCVCSVPERYCGDIPIELIQALES